MAMNYAQVYFPLVRKARTINHINKIHIDLDRSLTPGEARDIIEASFVSRFPIRVRRFLYLAILKTLGLLKRTPHFWGKKAIECFVAELKWRLNLSGQLRWKLVNSDNDYARRVLSSHARLFMSATNSPSLLIGFSGRAGNFGPKTPILLSALSGAHSDFLSVYSPMNQQEPWTEIGGFEDGIEGFVRALEVLISERGYQEVHTAGLSFGAPLSLVVGAKLSAKTITAIGLSQEDEQLGADLGELWHETKALLSQELSTGSPELSFVVGSLAERDRKVAQSLRGLFPRAKVVLVENAPHAPIGAIKKAGQLQEFFDSLFLGFKESSLSPILRTDTSR